MDDYKKYYFAAVPHAKLVAYGRYISFSDFAAPQHVGDTVLKLKLCSL